MGDGDSLERGAEFAIHGARRVLSEAQVVADPKLVAEGWQRRFVADSRRVEEAIELYTQLGFEVRAEPIKPGELAPECGDCQLVMLMQFRMIYTRKT